MQTLWHDLRYAFRMWTKDPGPTLVALITLALGIGVNTALFSVVDAMRRMPDRYADADTLAFLWQDYTQHERQRRSVSAMDYLDWSEQATSFSRIALFSQPIFNLTTGDEPQRVQAVRATANLLPMLGFDASIGRLHATEDGKAGASRVVVLSDGLWRRSFDADPNIVGQMLTLDEEPHTIIGVLPPECDFEPFIHRQADLLVPLRLDPARMQRGQRGYYAIARLAPGIGFEQAEAEMAGIGRRLAEAYPETNADTSVWIQPLRDRLFSTTDKLGSLALLGAVGCVLLIACVNLANLLLAKATSRGREFAVRGALGAGRGRLVRQLLTESLLLAAAGGALGLLVGVWAMSLFVASQPDAPFRKDELGLQPAVFWYTAALSVVAALIFGLAPALTASRVSVGEALKEGGASTSAGTSRNRLRRGLVIGQLALTLPLIVCAGLVVRHIIALRSVDVGFYTERLLVLQVDLPSYRYDTGTSQAAFVEAGVRAARATPGVRSAAAVNFVPLGGARSSVTVTIEGREVADPSRPDLAGYQIITPGYFDMMETPILAGRDFGEHDHAEASRVVIVNRKMAARYWPNDDAVGKRLKAHFSSAEASWVTVVGVVRDVGHAGLYQEPRPEMFFPYTQTPTSNVVIVARTQGDPMEVANPLRGAVRRLDPGLPIYGVRSMADILHRWLRDDRMAVGFLCGLAVLALSLASIGLYGVMSYSVAQRTHEIGVRVALGAGGRDIQHLVLRRCLVMAAVGVAVGLALSCAVGLVLQSQLYGVSGVDPITFVAVSALLLAVAAAAGYVPARRATKIDPMVALRYE